MKSNKIVQSVNRSALINWLIFGGALATLYFNPNTKDPFNAPKLIILMVVASWIFGFIIVEMKANSTHIQHKRVILILLVFVVSYLIASVLSPVKFTAFFGENQRRTGFFTYLALSIIMLASILFTNYQSINKFFKMSLFIATALSSYGFIQTSGQDFVSWNNPYNSIISTLGNPNFAAATMAVFSVVLLGIVFMKWQSMNLRIASLLVLLFTIFIITKSEARQGLLALAIGASIIIVANIFWKNKVIGVVCATLTGLVGIVATLGMLQIGPLTEYLYKSSVTVRGYYWRAGIQMFLDYPLFGVGVDRFGAFFKEYREVEYPLAYGFNITSTNAHNVFIQHFATAGFFVGVSYLVLSIIVLILGVRSLKESDIRKRSINVTLFAAWASFQAQSIISIDNIGLTYWGWFLSGAIIALSATQRSDEVKPIHKGMKSVSHLSSQRVLLSIIVSIPALVVSVFIYRGEINMKDQLKWYNPAVPENREIFLQASNKTMNSPFLEPYYRVETGAFLAAMGYPEEGLRILKSELVKDGRNLDNLQILASFSEQLSNYAEVIRYREQLATIDPFNAENYLKLGLAYKGQGDLNSMNKMLDKILSFASNDPIAAQARAQLSS
jgi:O-antigen ligase